jgi:NADPH:quinone reductase-like Zn-dependent oxidoreductase
VVRASVNPVDWKQASGKLRLIMPVKFPCVPGYDLAGEVVGSGEGASQFVPGMRVHTRLTGRNGGASAEYALCTTDTLTPMPDGMDVDTAAGLPLAGMTALQGLRDRAGMPMRDARERVLVVGASGGVGHLAVQIARAAGATVVGVCSGRNVARVLELGAHVAIDYTRPQPFAGEAPFDVVLDCVADEHDKWLPLLTPTGRYASCTPSVWTFLRQALNPILGRQVRAVMLQSNAADLRVLDALFAAGRLRVLVDGRFPLEQLPEAWARSQSGRTVGKILIDVA